MRGKSKSVIPIEQIDGMIRTIRGSRVILDSDPAKIYGVPTFRFNEAIKRNRYRFPEDFMFQLTTEEAAALRSQTAILNEAAGEGLAPNSSQIAMLKRGRGQHRKYRPYAFTEHGALQAANVLRSPRAVQMNTTCPERFRGWIDCIVRLGNGRASRESASQRLCHSRVRKDARDITRNARPSEQTGCAREKAHCPTGRARGRYR